MGIEWPEGEHLASEVVARCDALAQHSEMTGGLYRSFGRAPLESAAREVEGWMREAGMAVRRDPCGTVVGVRAGTARPDGPRKTLYLGSHLDTVPDGGRYDGALGVVLPIAVCRALGDTPLPFDICVLGFLAEEGARFGTGCLSARAAVGDLDERLLAKQDAEGLALADAIRFHGGDPQAALRRSVEPDGALGFVEVHIEQAPVLERQGLAVGVVDGIVGQTRARLVFSGTADHAGTTDMADRSDALCAAAEFVLEVERVARSEPDLFATVGRLEVSPNAGNVIPGRVVLSLDVRHPHDAGREVAVARLAEAARSAAGRRSVGIEWQMHGQRAAARCAPELMTLLDGALADVGQRPLRLPSRAGHDAMVLARLMPMAMFFVRSPGGVSHHPDERLEVGDVAVALDVLSAFLQRLSDKTGSRMDRERLLR